MLAPTRACGPSIAGEWGMAEAQSSYLETLDLYVANLPRYKNLNRTPLIALACTQFAVGFNGPVGRGINGTIRLC